MPVLPWGSAALLAPVFMFWILNYVTGVPPLEAQMARSRGERGARISREPAASSRFHPKHDPRSGTGFRKEIMLEKKGAAT